MLRAFLESNFIEKGSSTRFEHALTHQSGLADLEAAAAAADPIAMEFVFHVESVIQGARIARSVVGGVSERKLICGSARNPWSQRRTMLQFKIFPRSFFLFENSNYWVAQQCNLS